MTSVFEGIPYVIYESLAMQVPVVAPALAGNLELSRRRPVACWWIRATTWSRTPMRWSNCCARRRRARRRGRGRPHEQMLAQATRSKTMERPSTRRCTSALLRAPRRGRAGAGPGADRGRHRSRLATSSCRRASRRLPRATSAMHRALLPARPLPERLPDLDRVAVADRRRSRDRRRRLARRRHNHGAGGDREVGVRGCCGMRAQRRPQRRPQPCDTRVLTRPTCCPLDADDRLLPGAIERDGRAARGGGARRRLHLPDRAALRQSLRRVASARLESAPAPKVRTSARRRRCSTLRVFACRRPATTKRSSSATRTGT